MTIDPATPEFAGEFETHVTVNGAVERLRLWAEARGLKCVHVVLDRGETASQPMITRRGFGTLARERHAAEELAADLVADGFEVVRTKIEAAPTNAGVPADDDAAARAPATRYFEHHVKLLLNDDGAAESTAADVVRPHGGHLSRNAFKLRDDGKRERFITQRCHAVGRPTATRRFDALVEALRHAGLVVLDTEKEYVVVDDNLRLDADWCGRNE